MEAISLTTFADFMNKSGPPKMTVVSNWKNGDTYKPWKDYWKNLRDAIVRMHRGRHPHSSLSCVPGRDRESDADNYSAMIRAYKRWCGKQTLNWFPPPKLEWNSNGVRVIVNPELGLEIDGVRHLIKLYFKDEKLPANRAALALQMMHDAPAPKPKTPLVMGMLDIRKGRLHTMATPVLAYRAQLVGEAAYWAAVYANL